jgi:hypothetical protein
MSRRSGSNYSSYYSSYGKKDAGIKIPNPLPYLLVVLIAAGGLGYFHYFAFKSLSGKVTNAYTGAAMPGLEVVVRAGGQPTTATGASVSVTGTTTPDGSFQFARVPDEPLVSVGAEGFASQTISATGKTNVEIALVPNTLSGRVTSSDGKGIPQARIFSGSATTVTGDDGSYLIKDLPSDRRLVVKSAGYLANTVSFDKVNTLNVTLEPFTARAIYINADSAATPGTLQQLISMLDRTELNAVVIDVKADNSGIVLYSSKLPLVEELDTARPIIPDLPALLKTLKDKKIYTIARLSVFWDQAVTSTRPEWALKSKKAPGQPWTDSNQKFWANPYLPEVRDYNIAIAREVAEMGFNEVQFDNLQFPADGELDDIDFGPAAEGKKRVDAISSFLDYAYTALSPLGVYIGVNVFGLTAYVSDDMGVGQSFEAIAQRVDFICPTIYPSQFADGFNGYEKPAEVPGDIVGETVKQGLSRFNPKTIARIRPWLQDFSVTGKVPYDPPKVRAQIDAAEQNGAFGWMLWNLRNNYTEAALKQP